MTTHHSRQATIRAIALLMLLVLAPAARAQISLPPDLQVAGVAVALRQNGAFVPIPAGGAPIPFFPSDTLEASIQLSATIGTPTQAADAAFDVTFEWVGRDCPQAECEVLASFVVGDIRLDGPTDVGTRNPLDPQPVNAILPFHGPFFSLFALAQAQQSRDIQLRVTLDTSDEIDEFVETNNTAITQTVVNLVPALAVSTVRIGPIDMTPIALDLQPDAGCGGTNPIRIVSGTALWEVAANGTWDAAEIVLSEGCANLLPNPGSNQFILDTSFGGAPEITGTLGGLPVAAGLVLLANSGALPQTIQIVLPDGHSVHAPDPNGRATPRGTDTPVFSSFPSGAVDDFSDLVAAGPPNRLLQAPALPFTLRLDSLTLDATGLHGDFDQAAYTYAYPYEASDLRRHNRQGPRSNDARYRAPSGVGGTYTLGPDGLDADVPFGQGDGRLHYPHAEIAFSPFQVAIDDGEIADDSFLPAPGIYGFRQSPACADCPPASADWPMFELFASAGQGIANDGAVLAPIGTVGSNAAWGPYDDDSGRFVFERRDDDTEPGLLYIPGFVATGSGGSAATSVSESLLGMRRGQALGAGEGNAILPTSLALLSSAQSRRGNGFAAGLNLGPELLKPANGLPDPGVGSLLTDTQMWVGFGGVGGAIPPDFTSVTTNEGTKLVVRRRGVTGVFNTTTPPQPSIYDFQTDLYRFAVRTETNELDPFTWIDGLVQVPGAGDFEIAFSSLELLCTGDIGSGAVDQEDCDDGNPDSNGNGLDDENCNEHLGSWNTRIEELISMRFVPEDPSAAFCDGGDRLLEMGSSIDVVALDEPIGLISQWFPDGEPGEATITGDTDRVYDRPSEDSDGFRVALGNQVSLQHTSANDGWYYVESVSHNVSLWDAIEAGVRFRNDTEDTQGQTVVGPKDAAFITTSTQDNDAVAGEMDTPEGELPARYLWANSFSVDLPVVFATGRSPVLEPRFRGHVQEQDLIVLQSRANVDFIDPDATKASIGVSAELSAQALLSELSHLTGLVSGILGFDIEGIIAPVRAASDTLTGVAGSGFGEYLEGALRDHLDDAIGLGAGNQAPIPVIANSLTELNSLPGRLAGQLSGSLEQQVDRLTGPLQDPDLDAIVANVAANLADELEDAILASPDDAALDAFEQDLTRLSQALAQVEALELDLQQVLGDLNDALAGLALSDEVAGVAQAGRDAIQSLLDDELGLPACNADHPILARIAQFRSRMDALAAALDAFELVGELGSVLPGVSEETLTALTAAQQDIGDLAEDILARVTSVTSVLDGLTGCAGAVSYADLGDTQLVDELTAVQAQLDLVPSLTQLTEGFLAGSDGLLGDVEEELAVAFTEVRKKSDSVETLLSWVALAKQGTSSYEGMGSAFAINLWLTERGLSGPVPFTQQLRDQLSNPIQERLGLAAFVGTFLPLLGQQEIIGRSHTADSLMDAYLDALMNDDQIEAVEGLVFEHLDELVEELGRIDGLLMEQVNALARAVASAGDGALAGLLENNTATVEGEDGGESQPWNLLAANLDGSVLIEGEDIALLQVDGSFKVGSDDPNAAFGFEAGLEIESWSHSGKDEGCAVFDSGGFLDATIEARNLPFRLGVNDAKLERVAVGFTLADTPSGLRPVGASGAVEIEGRIGAASVALVDPAFAAAFGRYENAVGFTGLALVDDIAADVGFLVGQTCNRDLLRSLDPQVDEYIGDLIGPNFAGLYVRAGLSSVIWNNGCVLQLGVGMDVGGWFLVTTPPGEDFDLVDDLTLGGLYGGSIFGTGACLVSIRGAMTTAVTYDFGDMEALLSGDVWVAGGLGICSPAGWKDVGKSRGDDPFCGTVDAQMGAQGVIDLGGILEGDVFGSIEFDIAPPSFGGIH